MKNILGLSILMSAMLASALLSGCASAGNVTHLTNPQTGQGIICWEPKNKFTTMLGYATVKVDEPRSH